MRLGYAWPKPGVPRRMLMTFWNSMHVRWLTAALVAVALSVAAAPVRAEDYPSRPITLIVPFPPGGSSDIVMRLVAHKVAEGIKQPIIIENRSGAAGNVAAMA